MCFPNIKNQAEDRLLALVRRQWLSATTRFCNHFVSTHRLVILAALMMFCSLLVPFVAAAEINIDGVYTLLGDSDNTKPKKNAIVTLTFRGRLSGTLSMSAIQPGETVTDTGNYSVSGSLITIRFKEMEWEANRAKFQFDGCTLVLPFKALGGSPGPGTSTWRRQEPRCNSVGGKGGGGTGGSGAGRGGIGGGGTGAGSSHANAQAEPDKRPAPDNDKSQSASGVTSDKETCVQCKYIPCIQTFIKVRQAYVKTMENDAFVKGWGDLGGAGRNAFDLGQLDSKEAKASAVEDFNEERKAYWREFDSKIDRGLMQELKKNCGLTGALRAESDPVYCTTDPASMKRAADALPCRDLFKAVEFHESFHVTRCWERAKKLKDGKGPYIPTVRGEVSEEVQAYRQEISVLKGLLKEITEKKQGCWRCGKTQQVFETAPECSATCPRVSLGGSVMFQCFKINTTDGGHENRKGDQF